ncbi:Long-chain fatty acid transport protein [Atopomonas hussainii]|uniref:Long-chain fatty acid transport protein n=1 Tax=Atopomonas hussainii TaxID=1429083 RepID=A0A1H7ME42_9GAMM|nr:outer membrane protein transport protein [Atopomonas hussainii]SEL08985.1 Long-chain fatty acid transport protein [Atopomonas hussainii]
MTHLAARLLTGLGSLCLFVGVAHAQLAQNLTIGNPKAMALGNAITADSSGIDAVHYNPAALTKLKGRQTQMKLLTGIMDIRAKFDAPAGYGRNFFGYTNDDVAGKSSRTTTPAMYLPGFGGLTEMPVLAAPLAGISVNPPGSKFTFATNVYAPQALGFSRDDDDDPARYQGRKVAIQRITYLSPSVAYQMNDELSFGLSVGFSHQAMALNQDFRAPGPLTGVTQLFGDVFKAGVCATPITILVNFCGASLGPFTNMANLDLDLQQKMAPSWNVGVLWEPVDWFAWGATYQSESRMHLQGKYRVDYSHNWQSFWSAFNSALLPQFIPIFPNGAVDEERGSASLDLTYPDHFSTGIKFKPHDDWQVNLDLKWTDYADWNEFTIEFDRELDMLRIAKVFSSQTATSSSITLDRGYESVWSWALGVQYDVNERLSLRAGYEPRPSSIPGNKADVLAPVGDAVLYGLGMGYRWDKDTVIDVGFNYFVSEQDIPAGTSCNVNCSGIDKIVYNPYADLDVKTKTTAYIMAITYRTTF